MTHASDENVDRPPQRGLAGRILGVGIFGILLPVCLLAVAAYGATRLMESGPKTNRRPPERRARLVTTEAVHTAPAKTTISAQGTVRAARSVEVQPRVSGEVASIDERLVPGGVVHTGDTLAQIDPADYAIAVRQRTADRDRAKSDLELELGRQDVAREEYELIGSTMEEANRDLVLRKPQLDAARAALASAEAALERAELDRSRTTVKAPFNALVRERYVDVGAQVSAATRIAALEGTDEFWIEVVVPTDRLKWIKIPGATVRVYDEAAWGEGRLRSGTVLRQTGDLEEAGRMARLLVAVHDPFALESGSEGKPILLLGSYVRVEIVGLGIEEAISVDRRLLRNGDRVWVMSPDGALQIRPVQVGFRGVNTVYVTEGLEHGERLVTSDLSAPVEGMPLRTAEGERQSREAPDAR